ncbi:AAA family ATPase [Clostridium tagluense]|uniref:Uncharacterized protein n=1 Tax=Clostridium tagluense TaxID=360422 RepID=A0A401UQD7_9CLOT|nr:AAA family ATPase [Clostridium tagluense]GCD11708.1 hypothetical protein Ctaglu_33310 [Clostridium tagluense]
MGRRQIGEIRQVSAKFEDYSYLMNGIGGIGKTTAVVEMGQKLFGIYGYLHLTIGKEPKPEHIGNLWSDVAETWEDVEEIIDQLCDDKDKGFTDGKFDYSKLKMVGIDSTDEIFRLAEARVVEMNNKKVKDPSDKVDTIKRCFGGYQAGENKTVEMVVDTVFKLREHGICPFFIGHTKSKNKVDQMTDVEFEQITSNLDNKYYTALKDKVSMVMCAYTVREMTDLETMKDAFTKKNKQVGKIASEKRVIAFRDEEFAIDLKSHLKYIVDKCEFTSDNIIAEIQLAIGKQIGIYPVLDGTEPSPVVETKKDSKKVEKKVEEIKEKIIKKPIDESKLKKEKLAMITSNLSKLDMSKLQAIMAEYTIINFEDPATIAMDALDKIIALIK